MNSNVFNPVEHAAAILEAIDGNQRLLSELLPSFLPTWIDCYGKSYCSALVAALTTPQGQG